MFRVGDGYWATRDRSVYDVRIYYGNTLLAVVAFRPHQMGGALFRQLNYIKYRTYFLDAHGKFDNAVEEALMERARAYAADKTRW